MFTQKEEEGVEMTKKVNVSAVQKSVGGSMLLKTHQTRRQTTIKAKHAIFVRNYFQQKVF